MSELVADYTKKTDSLVIFTSQDVSTLMRFSKVIYYFEGSHLTSARNVEMLDSVDCVVTIIGTGFPVENAVKHLKKPGSFLRVIFKFSFH